MSVYLLDMPNRTVSSLPAPLRQRVAGRDLIVFDGVCLLCNAMVDFVLARESTARFHFVTAQSDLGQTLYHALDLPTEEFDTVLVIVDGEIHTKAQAAGAVLGTLGGVWQYGAWLKRLPPGLTDWAYHLIARNRYRLFGRSATCRMPDPTLASRFLT